MPTSPIRSALFVGLALCLGCAESGGDPAPPAGMGAGKDDVSDPPPGDVGAADRDPAAPTAIHDFSWVTPSLAGLPRPGIGGKLPNDLAFLAAEEVNTIVSLTVTALPEEDVSAHGMALVHIPIVDGQPPTPAQIDEFVALAKQGEADGTKIAVHCTAGRGRTGTMLAAWFISSGMSAADALSHIRKLRPLSVETSGQEQALEDYAARQG